MLSDSHWLTSLPCLTIAKSAVVKLQFTAPGENQGTLEEVLTSLLNGRDESFA